MVYFLAVTLAHTALLDHQGASLVPAVSVLDLLGPTVVLTVLLLVIAWFLAWHDVNPIDRPWPVPRLKV